jgi:hypothetical protein
MKQASITLITALQLPTRPAPINTGFQPGAANPRQNPNRFPTVSRSTQGIQKGRTLAPARSVFFPRVLPTRKRGAYSLRTALIQPLNRSRTGVVQVKTGLIQVNTGKYSLTGKNALIRLDVPACLGPEQGKGKSPNPAQATPHGHGPGRLSQLELFELVCGCWSLKHRVFDGRKIAKDLKKERKAGMRVLMLLRGMNHNCLKQPAGGQTACPVRPPLLCYGRLSSRNGTNSRT